MHSVVTEAVLPEMDSTGLFASDDLLLGTVSIAASSHCLPPAIFPPRIRSLPDLKGAYTFCGAYPLSITKPLSFSWCHISGYQKEGPWLNGGPKKLYVHLNSAQSHIVRLEGF